MIKVFVTFMTGWEGWGTLFALLLIFALLGSAFNTEVGPVNPFYELHEASTFDSDVRDIGTFTDKNGNKYSDALMFNYGYSTDKDVYRLDGKYTSFSGTVFVPTERLNEKDSGQVSIYGDGKRLWASSHMTAESDPEDFAVNTTNIDTIEIRYEGGAITWKLPIAIGNIQIGNDVVNSPAVSQLPTRLLDLPMKESSFVCRYTHWTGEDYYGNNYEDTMFYLWGEEDDRDVYLLNGQFSKLSGTIYIPTERTTISDEWCLDRMYYVHIYGDGNLLFTSPQMANGQAPVNFEISVEGVQELTITYYGGAMTWKMPIAFADLLLTQ